jgi:hypothetical protein
MVLVLGLRVRLIVSGSVGKMAYARRSRSCLTGRAGCANEAFGVAAPKAFISSSSDGAPHRSTLANSSQSILFPSCTIFPASACFLLLIFSWLDFENHFQEIGIIRRELGVVNHFLIGI